MCLILSSILDEQSLSMLLHRDWLIARSVGGARKLGVVTSSDAFLLQAQCSVSYRKGDIRHMEQPARSVAYTDLPTENENIHVLHFLQVHSVIVNRLHRIRSIFFTDWSHKNFNIVCATGKIGLSSAGNNY